MLLPTLAMCNMNRIFYPVERFLEDGENSVQVILGTALVLQNCGTSVTTGILMPGNTSFVGCINARRRRIVKGCGRR